MSNPFNFKIKMSLKERLRRRLLLSVTAAVLLVGLVSGLLRVYVNSYNILHAEPMEVFGVHETPEGTGVVILNKLFMLDR